MTLILQRPTGSKLTLRQTWQPMDPDAAAYITAVETADGQALEEKVKIAIDNFVLGCKADGIWNAIKASCILAGARTLTGALVPLKGTAPTNYNFVSGDYNRETGLIGNGSTKYLDSNRNNNADPQDNVHQSVYASSLPTSGISLIGAGVTEAGSTHINSTSARNRSSSSSGALSPTTGFYGHTRNTSSAFTLRINSVDSTLNIASQASYSNAVTVFARSSDSGVTLYSNPRLAFYSIGESLDLARLDARVTDLINAIGVAIP